VRRLRLLVVSRIPDYEHRMTAALTEERNRFVAEIAAAAVVVHAGASSRTEARCRAVLELGKPLWTLDEPENAHLVALGARPFNLDSLPSFFA
jgi:predicted Rossmann fold nucleotide-binding protein DprA/Smf involved in DNA uptake